MKSEAQTRTYKRSDSAAFSKTKEAFGGLSNMAAGFPLRVNGVRIRTSEALYQACRFPHRPEVQRLIIGEASPMTAKMKSKPYRKDSRPDWDRVRVKIMRWCLRVKLAQNWNEFSRLLLATRDRPIVEESRKDDFWGAKVVDEEILVGMNVLGRLLMELREEVKQGDRERLSRVEPLDIPDFRLYGEPISTIEVRPAKTETESRPYKVSDSGTGVYNSQVAAKGTAPSSAQASLFESEQRVEANTPSGLIASLKPYSEYEESGEAWIGAIPKQWNLLPNRAIFAEVKDKNHPDEEMLSVTINGGIIRQKALLEGSSKKDSSNRDRSAYKLVCPQDIAYNKMRAWQGAIGVSDYRGIISPAYVVMRLRDSHCHNPRYFHHLFRTPHFAKEAERWSYGITSDMWSLRPEHFKVIYTPLPPPDEQAAIVRFLDYMNRRIERAIRAKRKVVALLNEQKQAIIHRAVTRGLDPNVRLKPSGIHWLGDIPAHWEIRRIKQGSRILRGKFSHRPRNDPGLYNGPYPFIQTGAVARAKKYITEYSQTLNEKGLAVSKRFPAGTLVMAIAANIGDVAILTFDACFPDSVVGFVPAPMLDRDYLYLVLSAMKEEFLREAPVNTQGNLNVERIGAFYIPLPPIHEQQKIASYVDKETSVLEKPISRAEQEISFIREYRTRLTADVVTGKLDVCVAARNLHVEIGEPEMASGGDGIEVEDIEELASAEGGDE